MYGVGGEALHEWILPTRTFQTMQGAEGGETGVDDDFAARGMENVGAWILGRNMFGPIRGYSCSEHVNTAKAAHFTVAKRGLS